MIKKTDKEFADFCGVSASAVCKARQGGKLNKTPEGYETNDPKNHAYAVGNTVKTLSQRGVPSTGKAVVHDPLDDQKKKADILLRKKQARKLDREHDREMKNTIPTELMAIWIGYFAEGIRNNLLPVGSRVARGDVALRNRIEKEMKRGIDKTIEGAARELEKEGKKLIEALEEK